MDESRGPSRPVFAALVAGGFVALTLPRLLLHEPWRDEAWLWLVATESRSFSELLVPLQRSGQGNLFPVLCFLAARISTSVLALQLLHLALAAAAAWTFARWAPFRPLERLLVVLGYFPFYEYAVISRHYAAGMLLAWLACAAARSRRPAIPLGLALGLLCQTTVYGWILAAAIGAGWLVDRRVRRAEVPPIPAWEAAAGTALALGGAAAGIVQLVPAAGTTFAPAWRAAWSAPHARGALAMPFHAFIPLPRPEVTFWNSNLLDALPGVPTLLGVVLLALALAALRRSPAALATFGAGAAGLLSFAYLKYVGVARHHGHLWLLLLAAAWLGTRPAEGRQRRSGAERALLALLVVHAGAAGLASAVDLARPFSNGKAIAELIRSRGLDGLPLLGYREPPAATVSLFLGRPLWSPSRGLYATRPDWGPTQRDVSESELRRSALELRRAEGRDVVLVVNRRLPPWPGLEPVGSRVGAIEPSEDFYLYVLRSSGADDEPAHGKTKQVSSKSE